MLHLLGGGGGLLPPPIGGTSLFALIGKLGRECFTVDVAIGTLKIGSSGTNYGWTIFC